MGQRYLIDSNAIINYTTNALPEGGSAFLEHLFNTDFLISVVVKIELLGFDQLPAKLRIMEEFIGHAFVLVLDEQTTQQAILLRRKHKKLKLGDAIIAATALVHGLAVVTRNLKDFSNIKGLHVVNPWEIK